MKIGIVGAGCAGCLSAILLSQRDDVKVYLYEKRRRSEIVQDGDHHSRSTLSLTINKRGQDALEKAGLLAKVQETGVWLSGLDWHWQEVVQQRDYHGGKLLSVRRNVLLEILLEKCEQVVDEIHFGHETKIDDQFRQDHDVIVGADGAYSTVRNAVDDFSSEHNIVSEVRLGYIDFQVADPADSHIRLDRLHLWSPNDESSPVHFMLALPTKSRGIDFGVYGSMGALKNVDQVRSCLETYFGVPFGSSLQEKRVEPLRTLYCPKIVSEKGDVVLIGDAACIKMPFLGLGANSAMEDAVLLAETLTDAIDLTTCYEHLKRYGAQRVVELELISSLSMEETENFLEQRPHAQPERALDGEPDLFDIVSFTTLPITDAVELYRVGMDSFSNLERVPGSTSSLAYAVKVGESVKKGQVVGVVDSVKTRKLLHAERSGQVVSVDLGKGSIEINGNVETSIADETPPFRLNGLRLQELLTKFGVQDLGRFVSYRKVTESTMDDAVRQRKETGGMHGSLFVAEQQTKGRGRGGRKWESQFTGNIYITLVMDELVTPIIVPIAVCNALRDIGLAEATIKWPNDILVSETWKISGMLVEENHESFIVGIGINVFEHFDGTGATSVRDQLPEDREILREEIIARVCGHLEKLNRMKLQDIIHSEYHKFESLNNRLVKIESKKGLDTILVEVANQEQHRVVVPLYGVAHGIDEEGRLKIAPMSENTLTITLNDSECSVSLVENNYKKRVVLIYAGPGADDRCLEMTKAALDEEFHDDGTLVLYVLPERLVDMNWEWESCCKLLVFPGGADIPMAKALGEAGQRRIKVFVEEKGGHYLGFCAGGYFGCSSIEFDKGGPLEVLQDRILSFFPGKAIGPIFPGFAYGKPQGAWCVSIMDAEEKEYWSYFNGGCYFEDSGSQDEKNNMQVLAWYNNLNEKRLPAIVKCMFENDGVVVLCGAHPEFDPTLGEWVDDEKTTESSSAATCPPHIPFGKGVHRALAQHDSQRRLLLKQILSHL